MSPTSLAIAPGDGDSTLATVVRPALPRFVLRGVGGAGFGRTFALVGPTVLGRAPDCGIHLDHPGVSRQHVRLTPTSEGLLVEDLGSTNGWLLNESVQQRAWAHHGDELGFDVLRFRVVAPGVAPAQPATPPKARKATPVWRWVAVVAVLGGVALLLLR
ncbi:MULTISPECIES: FHA domain-containing protein [unclassified Luteimonas]|uniref:FHA domain-containing protein n=1 Tax=unclassified Luteimonas TaxID=2629088 RepID=UPI0015FF15A9|nr:MULTISPECIES: FHA domain-containing protein [unclassified Luteimonas]MBB1472631.1 FHA domain-containing protein [Luteimonas sp. MC1782]MBB6598665.1 FHA domain-containing protein [Luteimonas sp. MC1825]QOC88840.1 FHA domain-containing protein [Luteimonas sp. MC1825]